MPSSRSPNASPKLSNVVTSFLDGRRRLRGLECDFSMRETKVECFMVRLSFLVLRKESDAMVLGRWEGAGREMAEEDFVRIDGRFWGAVGA